MWVGFRSGKELSKAEGKLWLKAKLNLINALILLG